MIATRSAIRVRPDIQQAGLPPASGGNRQAWRGGYWALALLVLLLALPVGMHSQFDPRSGVKNAKTDRIDPTLPMGGFGSPESMRLFLMLNAARQKSLVSDTDKLLKLARELDREISAGKSGSLTQEQLKKVAKIEKLAHKVKEGMSNTILVNAENRGEIPRYEP